MITIGLEQIKDCDHCSKTYGTLGCCTTVNNQWVYSCTEGQKEYIIDRVLEMLDKEIDLYKQLGKQGIQHRDVINALEDFRRSIVKLKEEGQE